MEKKRPSRDETSLKHAMSKLSIILKHILVYSVSNTTWLFFDFDQLGTQEEEVSGGYMAPRHVKGHLTGEKN
jgi:hypothetical protein